MYWVRRSGVELVGVRICNGVRGAEDPEAEVLYKMQSSITKITNLAQESLMNAIVRTYVQPPKAKEH